MIYRKEIMMILLYFTRIVMYFLCLSLIISLDIQSNTKSKTLSFLFGSVVVILIWLASI